MKAAPVPGKNQALSCLNRMIAAGLEGPSVRGILEERGRSDITCGRKPNKTWLIKTAGILSMRARICRQIPNQSA